MKRYISQPFISIQSYITRINGVQTGSTSTGQTVQTDTRNGQTFILSGTCGYGTLVSLPLEWLTP